MAELNFLADNYKFPPKKTNPSKSHRPNVMPFNVTNIEQQYIYLGSCETLINFFVRQRSWKIKSLQQTQMNVIKRWPITFAKADYSCYLWKLLTQMSALTWKKIHEICKLIHQTPRSRRHQSKSIIYVRNTTNSAEFKECS
jgi:hypothetical protein